MCYDHQLPLKNLSTGAFTAARCMLPGKEDRGAIFFTYEATPNHTVLYRGTLLKNLQRSSIRRFRRVWEADPEALRLAQEEMNRRLHLLPGMRQ